MLKASRCWRDAKLVAEDAGLSMMSRIEEIKFQQKYRAQEIASMMMHQDIFWMCYIRVAMMLLQSSELQLTGILLRTVFFSGSSCQVAAVVRQQVA